MHFSKALAQIPLLNRCSFVFKVFGYKQWQPTTTIASGHGPHIWPNPSHAEIIRWKTITRHRIHKGHRASEHYFPKLGKGKHVLQNLMSWNQKLNIDRGRPTNFIGTFFPQHCATFCSKTAVVWFVSASIWCIQIGLLPFGLAVCRA